MFLLAALASAATDISGKWSGLMITKTPDGQINSMPVIAEFKQTGDVVTGTAGVQGQEQFALEKGSLRAGQLTFVVHTDNGEYEAKLTVVGDAELKGEVTFGAAGGPKQTATLSFSRTK